MNDADNFITHATPVVSVLITFYNQEKFVDRTIGSVVDQVTSFPIEIIVGDDGSTDDTMVKLLKWERRFPNLIRVFQWSRSFSEKHEPIERASRSRLRLTNLARGEFITYLDGDDYYCDNGKLELQVQALQTHPNCCSCCHDVVLSSPSGAQRTLAPKWIKTGEIAFAEYWGLFYEHVMAFMFRLTNYQIGEADVCNFDDNTIVFLLARKGPVYYLEKPMAVYEQSDCGSWSARAHEEQRRLNLKDYYFEQQLDSSLSNASKMRHLNDLRSLLKMLPVDSASKSNCIKFRALVSANGLSTTTNLNPINHALLQINLLLTGVQKKGYRVLFKVKNGFPIHGSDSCDTMKTGYYSTSLEDIR